MQTKKVNIVKAAGNLLMIGEQLSSLDNCISFWGKLVYSVRYNDVITFGVSENSYLDECYELIGQEFNLIQGVPLFEHYSRRDPIGALLEVNESREPQFAYGKVLVKKFIYS